MGYKMDRRVLTEVRRALSSKVFKISVFFLLIILCALSFEEISGYLNDFMKNNKTLSNSYHNSYFLSKITSGEMMLVLPIICSLPAATAFIDDMNGKFIRFYLQRSGKSAYIGGKVMASIISGGLVMLLGVALYYIILCLLLTPMQAVLKEDQTAPYYIQSIFKTLSLMFLNCSFWALMGLVLATLTMNRYVAYSGSFIIFYLLVILYERYFPTLYIIYPKEWISPSSFTQLNGFALPLFLAELIIILCLYFASLCERRFNNGV